MGMGLGMGELLLIFLVALLLFGAKRLPEIGSSLGKGIREFKGSIREIENELKVPDTPKRSIHAPPTQDKPVAAPEESVEGQPRKLTTQD
jgi:sec-independent protein translocase protein TatA